MDYLQDEVDKMFVNLHSVTKNSVGATSAKGKLYQTENEYQMRCIVPDAVGG